MNAATSKDRVYIDPPTIPAGMTVTEYRWNRATRRRRLALSRLLRAEQPRRVNSKAMVI